MGVPTPDGSQETRMAYGASHDRQRLTGAIAAGAAQLLLAWFIVQGLAAHLQDQSSAVPEAPLVAFSEREREPEPPPPPPPPDRQPNSEGAPPGLKAEPRPREAPKPKIVVAEPTAAPTVAGTGAATDVGAAPVPGSGRGAGGAGSGTGTGTGGSGTGTGGGSAPVRIAGGLSDRDYPRSAAARRAAGTVAVSFRVRRDGRVDRCSVLRSSGDAELDGLTCSLVERRFVYRPARNAAGAPVESTLRTTFTWGTRGR